MANPDGAKARNEDANMAMTLASAGVRNDQEYSSDPDVEDISQSAANNSKKKSCFQITSVKASEIPQNDDNDSIDDMDESRAEDFSSSELLDISKSSIQTDLDRQDIRENSHSTPKKVTTNNVTPANSSIVNVNVNQAVPSNGNLGRRTGNEPPHELLHQISDPGKTTISDSGKTTNGSKLGNGNLEPVSRFKVVKVPRIEPFTRGRWKCRDFETQQPSQQSSADVVNRTEQQNKDVKSGESSAASSVHGENPNNENPLLGGENSTTGKSEQSKNNYSNTGRSGPGLKSHRPSQSSITHDDRGSLEDTIKETLNVDLEDPHAVDGDGTSAGGAIDNKIEQAMDLVKSHLLFAVREEVEVLKVQIKELAEKNEQLQRENAMLRQAPGAPMAMPQQTLPQQQPTALPQGIPQQQTTYSAAGAPQGQTLPPSVQQTQLHGAPMGMQTLPPQSAAQHPQGIPPPAQQQNAHLQQQQFIPMQPSQQQHPQGIPPQQVQLQQTVPQKAPQQQNLEQYANLQQSIPMQPSQQQQQQHSIPVTQQAGATSLQQGQPVKVAPNQAVQLNQAQQSSQPPKT